MNQILPLRFKRLFLMFALLSALLLTEVVTATESSLKKLIDLRADGKLAAQKHIPMLLLFSSENCEFCALIKQEYLEPMQVNKAYADKLIVREVPAGGIHYLRDFNGKTIGGDSLALRYGADLLPTVIFIDAEGRRLVPPLVGISSRHYYDQALEDHMRRAWLAIETQAHETI
jgi:thioredoxin-related protein